MRKLQNIFGVQMSQVSITIKTISKNQTLNHSPNNRPSKRYGQINFIYKNKFYVIGGHTGQLRQNNSSQQNKANIYCFNLQQQKNINPTEEKKGKKHLEQDSKWDLYQAKFSNNSLEAEFQINAFQAYTILPQKKRLYVFGGANIQGKINGCLLRLDLQPLEWSKPEQKGAIPKPRQDATLYSLQQNQKNFLLLFGGANYQTYELFSDLHLYQIQTKYWVSCQNLSTNFIQPRLNPSVCFNQNKIYLFGGYYVDVNGGKGYLNDLYQIQFQISQEKNKHDAKFHAKRLAFQFQTSCFKTQTSNFNPEPRCSASLLHYQHHSSQNSHIKSHTNATFLQKCLVLIGGQNKGPSFQDQKIKSSVNTLNDFWIFSLVQNKWHNISSIQFPNVSNLSLGTSKSVVNETFKSRCSFGTVYDKQTSKIYIFGGIQSLQNVWDDLLKAKLVITQGDNKKRKKQHLKIEHSIQVEKLHQFPNYHMSKNLVQQIADSISFPFAAIGLIIDNFVNKQAKFCDISYHHSRTQRLHENYIKFQSNVSLIKNSKQAFLQSFTCLKGGIRTYVQGTDKKIKTQMHKENINKEIGANFVFGGLRLGKQIIYITLDQSTYSLEILLVYQMKNKNYHQIINLTISAQELKFYISENDITFPYPQIKQKSDKVLWQKQLEKRKYFFKDIVNEDENQMINIIKSSIGTIKRGQIKSILTISKLKNKNLQYVSQCSIERIYELQLIPQFLKNDILYGDIELYNQLLIQYPSLQQCLDVSLKTYLSYLYSSCSTQFTLSVNSMVQRKVITVQQSLLKIDQMLKEKSLIQLSNAVEIDCKIIQLYTFPLNNLTTQSSKKLDKNNLFNNGILYYHKNRLIKRHKVELGNFLLNYLIKKYRCTDYSDQKNVQKNEPDTIFPLIFGHIEIVQAIPLNSTKTNFIFNEMLEKLDQKLRLMEFQIQKIYKNKKSHIKQ